MLFLGTQRAFMMLEKTLNSLIPSMPTTNEKATPIHITNTPNHTQFVAIQFLEVKVMISTHAFPNSARVIKRISHRNHSIQGE